jgi:hypothetical protein
MGMPNPFPARLRPGVPLALIALAGSLACPVEAGERHAVNIGARVIALNQCGFDGSSGYRCTGAGAKPAMSWSTTSEPALKRARRSTLTMKINPTRASLNFVGAVSASPAEAVVLTIAP